MEHSPNHVARRSRQARSLLGPFYENGSIVQLRPTLLHFCRLCIHRPLIVCSRFTYAVSPSTLIRRSFTSEMVRKGLSANQRLQWRACSAAEPRPGEARACTPASRPCR
jgi:hypothetical protein